MRRDLKKLISSWGAVPVCHDAELNEFRLDNRSLLDQADRHTRLMEREPDSGGARQHK
jgi:hypothetical protein